MHMSKL